MYSLFLLDDNFSIESRSPELQALVIEAAENDGRLARRPLKSHYREMLAHRILSSEVVHMMRRHGAALEVKCI